VDGVVYCALRGQEGIRPQQDQKQWKAFSCFHTGQL
jgi:hypothetical protein